VPQFDAILNEFRTARTSDERNDALRSLGRAQSPELIKRTLTLPLGEEVKGQDIYLPLANLRTSKDGITALWGWMTGNWDLLQKKLPPGLSMLGSVVSMCTSAFTHQDHMDEINKFFSERSTKGFDQSVAQSLDAIRAKAMWIERDSQDVKEWLKVNNYL
jgi:aminopeptidase 2